MKPGPGLAALKRELAQAAQGNRAGYVAWFKTGKGECGEGDKFIGVEMTKQRAIAEKYSHLELDDIERLLESRIHEHRLTALMILVGQYGGGDESTKRRVFNFYLKHTLHIDNWDLVDVSAPHIIGEHLLLPVAPGSLPLGQIICLVGATNGDRGGVGVHRQRRSQGCFRHCDSIAQRPARPHS
jgi:hypothetical protein